MPTKSEKYSAAAAFFSRGSRSSTTRRNESGKRERLSKSPGVSVQALSLLSKIAEDDSFTAEAARKDFGQVKRKKAA